MDGEPAGLVQVSFLANEEIPGVTTKRFNCITGPKGELAAFTYEKGDGLPAGSYVVTFKWPEASMASKIPDRLHGAYDNPAASEVTVTVEDGNPVDLGVIELSSKKKPPAKGRR
ncbi:MAG: hypothetical protein U0872_05295 [Planctomycetaceae bacterium]